MSGGLIGLGGKLRAGKDALGDYLEESRNFVKLGMSDALNEALLKLNPVITVQLAHTEAEKRAIAQELRGEYRSEDTYFTYVRYQELHDDVGYVEAKKNPEVRRLLQVLGTEVGRDMIDSEVWVKIAEKKILEHWEAGRDVVITAIRFPNELEMVHRLGGINIWIERPNDERWVGTEATPGHSMQIVGHASENSVQPSEFDYFILNDSTLDDLYAQADNILAQHALMR